MIPMHERHQHALLVFVVVSVSPLADSVLLFTKKVATSCGVQKEVAFVTETKNKRIVVFVMSMGEAKISGRPCCFLWRSRIAWEASVCKLMTHRIRTCRFVMMCTFLIKSQNINTCLDTALNVAEFYL